MSWGRINDTLDDHPKFSGISLDAAGLWLLCLPRALRADDGLVPLAHPARFLGGRAKRYIAELVDRGLWDVLPDGGWTYHDFDDYRAPASSRDQHRAAGRASAKARLERFGSAVPINAPNGVPNGVRAERQSNAPNPVPVPVPVPNVAKATTPKPPSGAVVQVFETWVTSTGHTACKLDAKRRRVIAARLAEYPLEDVLDAVQGWERDPWEGRRQQNEVTLLLRDAAHLEKFRDLRRQPGITTPNAGDKERAAVFDARWAAMVAKGPGPDPRSSLTA